MTTSRNAAGPARMRDEGRAGIYVHVPFCARKCLYCDFASYAGCPPETADRYFEALKTEIRLLKEAAGGGDGTLSEGARGLNAAAARALPADSLFIGGGTPSVVNPRYIAEIVRMLPLSADAEITMEANPGTVDSGSLALYREAGINRLSFGVQSFDDAELRFLGRIHTAADAVHSFKVARKTGFDNINLDLMFGFPGQTMDSWKRTLGQAAALAPEHLSFYSLQIEEGTPLYEMFCRDEVEQIPDELNRTMYHYAVDFLENNGYHRYEISNGCRPGKACRHNLKYWTMQPYIGLGAAAHSFLSGARYANPETVDGYLRFIEELKQSGSYFNAEIRDFHENTLADSLSDHMFTGLRLLKGISISEFENRYGIGFMERYGAAMKRHVKDGTMTFDGDRLAFTDKGIDISNSVLLDFI